MPEGYEHFKPGGIPALPHVPAGPWQVMPTGEQMARALGGAAGQVMLPAKAIDVGPARGYRPQHPVRARRPGEIPPHLMGTPWPRPKGMLPGPPTFILVLGAFLGVDIVSLADRFLIRLNMDSAGTGMNQWEAFEEWQWEFYERIYEDIDEYFGHLLGQFPSPAGIVSRAVNFVAEDVLWSLPHAPKRNPWRRAAAKARRRASRRKR